MIFVIPLLSTNKSHRRALGGVAALLPKVSHYSLAKKTHTLETLAVGKFSIYAAFHKLILMANQLFDFPLQIFKK